MAAQHAHPRNRYVRTLQAFPGHASNASTSNASARRAPDGAPAAPTRTTASGFAHPQGTTGHGSSLASLFEPPPPTPGDRVVAPKHNVIPRAAHHATNSAQPADVVAATGRYLQEHLPALLTQLRADIGNAVFNDSQYRKYPQVAADIDELLRRSIGAFATGLQAAAAAVADASRTDGVLPVPLTTGLAMSAAARTNDGESSHAGAADHAHSAQSLRERMVRLAVANRQQSGPGFPALPGLNEDNKESLDAGSRIGAALLAEVLAAEDNQERDEP